MGYAVNDPFGEMIQDYRSGIVASAVLNANRGPDSEPISPFDFFKWRQPLPEPVKVPAKGSVSDQQYAAAMIESLCVKA